MLSGKLLTGQRRRRKLNVIQAAAMLALASHAFGGSVITDGSLGSAQSLSGPTFAIPASLGKMQGRNLFHSFSQLNLSAGEVAAFAGPSTVENVLARVTGGASSIDGTLRVSIPHANFYLINPAGVMFGPNVSLDMTGAFVVTTADQIKLADGKVFGAIGPTDATLTSAAPATFGFLAAKPAAVIVNGSTLKVATRRSIGIAAGPIQLSHVANIEADQGSIGLLSVASPATAAIDVHHTPSLQTASVLGDISIVSSSALHASGDGGGAITVRGGSLTLANSVIDSDTLGAVAGRDVTVQLDRSLTVDAGNIQSDTAGSGRGGNVIVNARSILLNGEGKLIDAIAADVVSTGNSGSVSVKADGISILDGAAITSVVGGAGAAGNISVVADRLQVGGDGQNAGIASTSQGTASGRPGSVIIHARSATISDGGVLSTDSSNDQPCGDISIFAQQLRLKGTTDDVQTYVSSAGDTSGRSAHGGKISIHTQDFLIQGSAYVATDTFGKGDGGAIDTVADNITIDGRGTQFPGGIFAFAEDTSTGNAGAITAHLQSASIVAGGEIGADSYGAGAAGKVTIIGSRLKLDGRANSISTEVASEARNSDGFGNAGDVTLHEQTLSVRGSARISSATLGHGDAGSVSVRSQQLLIEDEGVPFFTGITSGTRPASTGAGGDVSVVSSSILLRDGGDITAATLGDGAAGNVDVRAGSMRLDSAGNDSAITGILNTSSGGARGDAGALAVRVGGELVIDGGAQITTAASAAAGGDLTVQAGTLRLLDGAIETDSQRAGGRISLTSNQAVISPRGRINASSKGTAAGDSGGNITINPGVLVLLPKVQSDTISANANQGHGGDITIGSGLFLTPQGTPAKALDSSSRGGLAGTIAIDSPDVDLSSVVLPLSGSLFAINAKLAPVCSMIVGPAQSSFTLEGTNGLPPTPEVSTTSGGDYWNASELHAKKP